MNVVRHMFYGSFGTQNSMMTFIFKFDLRKGQFRVKLDQIGSKFQIRNFLIKYAYVFQFCHRIRKMLIILTYDN